jgi:hypothetical protein
VIHRYISAGHTILCVLRWGSKPPIAVDTGLPAAGNGFHLAAAQVILEKVFALAECLDE